MATRNIIQNLGGLKQPRRGTFSVVARQPQRVLISAAGIGKPTAPNAGGSGGVIVETTSTFTIYSSDGLFSFTFIPVR